jgi:hypothetical protein
MGRVVAGCVACLCIIPTWAQSLKRTQITPQEKAAFSAMFSDSKRVFDQAQRTAEAAAAQVDIEITHENLRDLESVTDSAMRAQTSLRVPPTLESQHRELLASLRELRAGTRLQLSYWSTNDLSVIERGQTQLAVGIEDLNRFISEMNGFLAQKAPAPAQSSPAATSSDSGNIGVWILIGLGVVVYFLPAIVGRRKRNAGAIFVLNLLLGWTIIGWIVALVWACTKDASAMADTRPISP